VVSLFVSSNTVVHYLIRGSVPHAWGAVVFVVGVLGGGMGRATALYVAARWARYSVLIFMLSLVLFLSLRKSSRFCR